MTMTDQTTKSNVKEDEIISSIEIETQHAIALATKATSNKFGWDDIKINGINNDLKSENQYPASESPIKNPLSGLIKGYTAPFSLSALSSGKKERKLIRSAAVMTANNVQSKSSSIRSVSVFSKSNVGNFKMGYSRNNKVNVTNAGPKWFSFETQIDDPQLKRDLSVLRNRNYLDPKKFYKNTDIEKSLSGSKMVQLGTIVDNSNTSFNNRLCKRDRRTNITEQFMGEVFEGKGSYIKDKYKKMSQEKTYASQRKSKRHGSGSFKKRRKAH